MFQSYGILSSLTGVAFDASYQAVLDRATALGIAHPSNACKNLQNQLVVALKSANAWNRYDVWYTFASDSTDPEFATINWISPTTFKATRVNSPTYTTKKGFNARATTGGGYLNTNYNVGTQAVKFTRNDGAVLHYVDDNINANSQIDYGVGGITSQRITCQTGLADNTKQWAMSSSIATSNETSDAISKGLWLNQRKSTAAADMKLYRDGVVFDGSGASSGQPFPSYELTVCCLNTTNTTYNNFSLRNIGMFATGDGQTGLETSVPTIWYTYFNALQAL